MLLNKQTLTVTYTLQMYIPPDSSYDKQKIDDLGNRSEVPWVVYCYQECLFLRAHTIIYSHHAEIVVAWCHTAQCYSIHSGRQYHLLVTVYAVCEADMLHVRIGESREGKGKCVVLMREIELIRGHDWIW